MEWRIIDALNRPVKLPMLPLYEARDPLEARLLVDHLAAHHIRAVVLGELLSGGAGELSALNYPRVWLVDTADLARAQQLLAGFLRAPDGVPWVCPGCATPIEGEFAMCWQCGLVRPA